MNTTEPRNFLKSLQYIHWALLFGVLLFGVYVAFEVKETMFFSYRDDKAFLYLAIIVAFIGNLSSKLLYKKLIEQISVTASLETKAVKFSTAHIFRIAMLEFPALMCVIFVLYSNNSFYFILVGILCFMMLALYPTREKFINDVPLTNKEKSIIENMY